MTSVAGSDYGLNTVADRGVMADGSRAKYMQLL